MFGSRALVVGAVSAGAVAFQVLLVRWFSIEYFHHFAYMAIGVAMLGYGASGTLAAVLEISREQSARWFWAAAVGMPFTLLAALIVVNQIALDPTQLAWDRSQWLRLAGVYAVFAVPFGVAALTTVLGLTIEGKRKGVLYGASFIGSGIGGILAVAVLGALSPTSALALPALLAAVGVTVGAATLRRPRLIAVCGVSTVISCAMIMWPVWRLNVSPYKSLAQVRNLPDARTVGAWSHPVGWLVAVEAPAFRNAPGLSLAYTGAFPEQTALFVDGDLVGALTHWDQSEATQLLEWLPASMAHVLGHDRRTLVLGAGGTLDVATALAFRARSVTAVELHPDIARLARDPIASFWADRSVDWIVGDARSFVARARWPFDVVAIGAISGGASVAGLQSLSEDFRQTEAAYAEYMGQLTGDGVLTMTSWLEAPPRSAVRQILTVAAALRRLGVERVGQSLVVARSWGTATILAKPSGFTAGDVDALRTWADSRRIDLDWYPGLDSPATRFHFVPEPTLFQATVAAVHGADSAASFGRAYPFDVMPAQDAHPYPNHFMRTGSLDSFLRTARGESLAFTEWGYLALVATIIQSIVAAVFLLILPLMTRRGDEKQAVGLRMIIYFAGLGFGYMAAEIAAIQQLSLLLGHPVYAVTVVVGAFLVFSGIGSVLSDKISPRAAWRATGAVAAILGLCAVGLLPAVHAVHGAPLIVRLTLVGVVLAPLAGLMGLPFALGLRTLGDGARRSIAWAWAGNGFASVIGAPLAALISIETGSPVVLASAGAAYALASIAHAGAPRF